MRSSYIQLHHPGGNTIGLFREHGTDKGQVIVPRLSSELGDLIAGEHDLTKLSSQQKVEFLFGLHTATKAMFEIGWIEHTNDWDWWVGFELNDGTYIGDDDFRPFNDEKDNEQLLFADIFKINVDEEHYEFAESEDYYDNKEVTVEFFAGSKEPDETKTIKVKDIAKVHFQER